MDGARITRLGLVVHPTRELDRALDTILRWSDEHGVEVVQVPADGPRPPRRRAGDAGACDVIVALGGDGTTLAALRAGAAAGKPVLGVACGSLGALTAVTADDLPGALDRLAAGDWTPRLLPALAVESERRRAADRRQRPRRRARRRRAGLGRGPRRRRAVHPLRRRRARRRDPARLERVHARGGRARAGARRQRHRLHAARPARWLLPAAGRGRPEPADDRARPRPRRRADRAGRPDPEPRRAALAAHARRDAAARPRDARGARRRGIDARRAAPAEGDHGQPADARAGRPRGRRRAAW